LAGDTSGGKHAFDDATGPPKGKSARRAFAGPVLKRRHVVNFQEVVNVTEHDDCSGDSDINPQGDAHFALPGDAAARAQFLSPPWPCNVALLAFGKSGLFGPSLDLEIIAQREAEEKNEGDRDNVLHNHQHLNA
jgi:hypothetical protein